jgi:crotonobetainyl-CoA:carnitine CoA-transferase CaiB-like acyl-CoA transferase
MPKPLAGSRILDLTTVVVGPVCTLRLADYGAEIIKIEPPGGDLMRKLGGPSRSGNASGTFLHLNRRKRSVGVQLKSPESKPILERLIASCDAVVANMRPEALKRLGLDSLTLRNVNPSLVHCTITGFGSGGPYAGMPAYDSVLQGVSGVAGLSELQTGRPRYAPLLLADHVVGEIAAGAILAALVMRERTGIGSALEVPMHETMANFVLQEHLGPATFVPPLGPAGDKRILNQNNCPLATLDGWISLTANTDTQCRALLEVIGREDLVDDPRFETVASRFANVDAWLEVRTTALQKRKTSDWLQIFRNSDIPAMPCHSMLSLTDDPHLAEVKLLREQIHSTEGTIRSLRPGPIFEGEVELPGSTAPVLGEDTRSVLSELGFTEAEIEAWFANKTLFDSTTQNSVTP